MSKKKNTLSDLEEFLKLQASSLVTPALLTDKGKKITKEAVKVVEKFDELFFAPLGTRSDDFNKKLILLLAQ